jgi:hypothetical protein
MAVENISLEAARDYLRAPRKGKVSMPFIREYVGSRQEPPSKKPRALPAEAGFSAGEASMPGILFKYIVFKLIKKTITIIKNRNKVNY